MEDNYTILLGPASPPDPPQDQPGAPVPPYLALIVHVAGVLLGYGRHLVSTFQQRAVAPSFTTIASSFGTANLSTILLRLQRGILRAAALERILLARIATGREVTDAPPPAPIDEEAQPATTDTQPEQPAKVRRTPAPLRAPPIRRTDAELLLLTGEEIERQVRRRPISRTIIEICLDLGVVPEFCTGTFWNELSKLLLTGGVVTVMRQKFRRQKTFVQEQARIFRGNRDWSRLKRENVHAVLGFFIGEEPVNPFAPAAATGPP